MTFRPARAVLFLCTTLCLFPGTVEGQDTIPQGVRVGLTYDPSTRPGVFVTAVAGEAGDSVRAILARDLDFGDRLNVISAEAGAPPPAGRFNYELYAKLGASAIVQTSMTREGSLHVVVHDVAAKRVLNVGDFAFGGATPLSPDWRMTVHRASDEVERWITSVRGIAATRILYVRDQRLWIVDSDGANATPLGVGGTALSPAWHPTGRYVAYTAMADDGLSVVLRNLQNGQSRRMPRLGGSSFTPTFSPDGSTLVYSAGDDGTDLFAVSPFGGEAPRRVTFGRGTPTSSPSFSPDGRKLAYISGRLGHPEVYITDADGTNAELLTEAPSGDRPYRSDPDWSPDGRTVAFTSQEGPNLQVMVISLRDRRIRQLTGFARNENPSWAPDSRHIVFTSTRSGAKQLWVLDTESGRTRQLTRGGGLTRQPAWSPRLEQP
jgi:TolB protein